MVEKEYAEARDKVRAHFRLLEEDERVPKIAYVFSSPSSKDTIDINGPALPGLRELPLG